MVSAFPSHLPSRFLVLAISLTLLAGLIPGRGASAATGDPVLINEVLASTTGTDVEFIELFGTPGTSLDGLSLIVVEGESTATQGQVTFRLNLDGQQLGDNGFFLAGTSSVETTYGETPNVSFGTNALQNGSETFGLVTGASAPPQGGVVTGNEVVVDAVALTEFNVPDDVFYLGAPVVGPDDNFFPAGAERIEDGVDTDSAGDWELGDFNLSSTTNPNTPTAGTSGDPDPEPVAPCETGVDDLTPIHAIQGSGASTELGGQSVIARGVVTADFTSGGASGIPNNQGLRGFFMEAIAADRDADALTSEGIFVFDAGGAFDGEIGDLVAVAGTAGESFGATQITASDFEVCDDSGVPLPDPATLPLPTAPADRAVNFEPIESMRVTHEELTVIEFFQVERFGEIRLSADGVLQTPTNVELPGSPEMLALAAANAAANIVLDDGRTGQNLNRLDSDDLLPYVHEGGTLRIGDQLIEHTFVLQFGFGVWRLQPIDIDEITDELEANRTRPRPETPPNVGGTLKVASFNVLNYFDGDGQGGGFPNARGAVTASELERQSTKLVDAITRLDADIYGLIEIENDGGEFQATRTLVDALNAELGTEVYRFVDTGVIGTDAIKQAFIYNRHTVRPVGEFAILDSSVDPRFDDDRSRPALAQTFLRLGTGERVTVVVNHFKSKGSSGLTDENDPDFDQGDGQGFWNHTRTQSALALADWLLTNPTGVQSLGSLIIGDLNAYGREDPIRALEDAGYEDQLVRFTSGIPYTFTFDGMQGTLDTALALEDLATRITGAAVWHINADEVPAIDYQESVGVSGNLRFRTPEVAEEYYDPSAFRSSDHDPVLIGLDLGRSRFKGPS